MAQPINPNTFFENIHLTNQNSLTHLLDFDEEHSDLSNVLKASFYYTDTEFIHELNPDSCTIMSLNCQNLDSKFSEIKLLLDKFAESEKPIHVLCLQETWIEDSKLIDMAQFHINNYHLLAKNCYASAHGGLAIYIHKNWNFKEKTDIIESPHWEEMFVEVTDPSNPSKVIFTVGNFYRPPHTNVAQLQSFNRHFANKLESMNTRDTTFVCGDYNINLLSVNSDEHSSSFPNGILSSGFLPAITLPTRASNNSTLIDNVFVNQQAEFNFSEILENEISDHQAVVVNTKLILQHTKTRYITIYSNSEEAKNNFKNDIISKNIFDRLNKILTNNPNENYNILEEEISNSLEIHMNKKTVKFNRRKHKRHPWITFGILHSINRKNSLYKKRKKTNSESDVYEVREQQFNQFKNTLRRTINHAKKLYFHTQFEKHEGNGTKTWRTVDNALNRKTRRTTPDAISIDNHLCTSKPKIADEFNNYFATICANNIIPDIPTSHTHYLNNATESTFNFKVIDNATTMQYLSKITNSHSCGHDNISSSTLKCIAHKICECLTLIINQSITTGIFPENLKIAKVVHIYKKDDQSQIKNYRPISVLPVISKIFKNAMHSQLMEYFTSHKLLSNQQYGFRPNRSTELATLELMDRNINYMNENHCPVNIYFLVMLSQVLMLLFVVSLKFLFWVHCCLIYIYILTTSLMQLLSLMSLCTHDTTHVSTLENVGTLNNIAVIEDEINKEITKIFHWLHSNKLLLNTDKSKFMVFFKHPKTIPKLKLTINDNLINK